MLELEVTVKDFPTPLLNGYLGFCSTLVIFETLFLSRLYLLLLFMHSNVILKLFLIYVYLIPARFSSFVCSCGMCN